MKRLSKETKTKYAIALAREAMIEKLTTFIEKRNNKQLRDIYLTYFRDDIHSLALAEEKSEEKQIKKLGCSGVVDCTEPCQSSEVHLNSSSTNSPERE